MTQKAKKALALEIIERLKQEYPDAGCTLDYDQAWKLLMGDAGGGTIRMKEEEPWTR